MPSIDLASSALAPGVSPVRVHYRDTGSGRPIVILHGGWGYEIYPFDRQMTALAATYRIVAPDRTGYGGSGRIERQETGFHRRAAAETLAVIDALGLEAPVVWGHSDGAVIALRMGIDHPGRLGGLIVEAAHFFRRKPASREFFDTMMRDPDALGERVTGVLAREHGGRWRDLIRANGDAWLRIASDPAAPTGDLYDGSLGELQVPTLVIHGAKDPRTEPEELEAMRAAFGRTQGSVATGHVGADLVRRESEASSAPTGMVGAGPRVAPVLFEILPDGGHSPHSERATADEVTRIAQKFLATLWPAGASRSDRRATPDPPGLPVPS